MFGDGQTYPYDPGARATRGIQAIFSRLAGTIWLGGSRPRKSLLRGGLPGRLPTAAHASRHPDLLTILAGAGESQRHVVGQLLEFIDLHERSLLSSYRSG